MEFPIVITLIRLLAPFLILRFPLIGILLCMFIDMYDWQIIDTSNPQKLAFYQNWDKTLDFYYQIFIVIIVFQFKDKIARSTAIFLFLYRSLGLMLFYTFHSRNILFLFPNLFENFVVFYLLYVMFTKKQILFTSKKLLVFILTMIAIPKMLHEYFQHFLLRQPWEIYDVRSLLNTQGKLNEYINCIIWGSVFYFIPLIITVIVVIHLNHIHFKKTKKKKTK